MYMRKQSTSITLPVKVMKFPVMFRTCLLATLVLLQSFQTHVTDGSKRDGVIKTGTTVGPDFYRVTGTWSRNCPESHPRVIAKGHYCCSHKEEIGNLPTCDSNKPIGPKSKKECCTNPIKCPNQLCRGTDGVWSTWGLWSGVGTFCAAANAYFDDRKIRTRVCLSDQHGIQICRPVGSTQEQVVPNESASPSCADYSEVVSCGGFESGGSWKCRISNLKDSTVCSLPNMPNKRSNGIFGRISAEKFWYCGGKVTSTSPSNGCSEYDKNTNSWTFLTEAQSGAKYLHDIHGVQVTVDMFLIIGTSEKIGSVNVNPSIETFYYESSSHKLQRGPDLPPPGRQKTCSVLLNETHVVAVGGEKANGNAVTEVLVNSADFSTAGPWTKLTDLPSARIGFACGVARPDYYAKEGASLIVVAGGKIGGSDTKSSHIYDTGTGLWRDGPSLPIIIKPSSTAPYLGSFVILDKMTFFQLEYNTGTQDWLWKDLGSSMHDVDSTYKRGVTVKKGEFTCQ